DPLTGLANRATFIERMRQAFGAARRGAGGFAILYIDLDHFKTINDTLGHPVGDELLRQVAERLRGCTRETDLVARLGGDEFAVVQADVVEPASAGALASTIQSAVTKSYQIEGNELRVTASIGIAPFVTTSASPDAMLAQADLALYRSKEEGRNRYRFHSDDLDDEVLERVALADELRTALARDELEIYYEPQLELDSNKLVGMQARVRWNHPSRGVLPASTFMEVAEKTGASIPLGQWVLDQACRQMREWRDAGRALDVVTVDLSMAQLKSSRELLHDVKNALEKWGLNPADLSFDVTEATLARLALMRNDVLVELRALGVRIAIDDFGSEYSSFDYLRRYRVNLLKITRALLDAATVDVEHAATVRAILSLARELGVSVVTAGFDVDTPPAADDGADDGGDRRDDRNRAGEVLTQEPKRANR
ncbi:MAG TPA: EAL domain-containing protein, partial [Gammaproteobacteria bacterium]|nr:EAL domain-containing protein [Gammaproteobacteria bacterium]